MSNRDPELGDRVKHRVTGFTGIVTSHSKHLAVSIFPAVAEVTPRPIAGPGHFSGG